MSQPRPQPRYVNLVSVCWFWSTMLGVYFLGVQYILPVLYAGYSPAWMLAHHVLTMLIFLQMALNWLCIRLVTSPFRPEDHMAYISSHSEEISNEGFEINLNHLKSVGECGKSFSVAVKGVKSVDSKKRWDKGTMYIMSLPVEEIGEGFTTDNTKKIVYPYWSWKPCLICQCQRPPRTHHCPLCNACVLKRDHHCFFTGSCIGLRNQRHFVVFTFWSSVATTYCLLHALVYLFSDFVWRNSYLDLLLPATWLRWLFGCTPTLDTIMMSLLYSLVWFWVTSMAFFYEQIKIIRRGVTSFEADNKMKITNSNCVEENLRGVFGDYWLVNFIFPLHGVFPGTDNGVEWNSIKV